jgi:hypothetical protein
MKNARTHARNNSLGNLGGGPCYHRGSLRKRPDRNAAASSNRNTDSDTTTDRDTTTYTDCNAVASWCNPSSHGNANRDTPADAYP